MLLQDLRKKVYKIKEERGSRKWLTIEQHTLHAAKMLRKTLVYKIEKEKGYTR